MNTPTKLEEELSLMQYRNTLRRELSLAYKAGNMQLAGKFAVKLRHEEAKDYERHGKQLRRAR